MNRSSIGLGRITSLALCALAVPLIATMMLLPSCSGPRDYPETAKQTGVVDEYFGVKVEDPYRWLENDTSAATQEWVERQRAYTNEYLQDIPFREGLKRRIAALIDYSTESAPSYTGKYYIFSQRLQGKNQPILCLRDSLGGDEKPRILIDVNTLSDDGTRALMAAVPSRDSKYLAYAIADAGSDWQSIYVMDLATGQQLSDTLRWVKFSSIAWAGDGFYYSRYDKPAPNQELSARNENHKVYFHKVGTPQDEDPLIFQDTKNPLRSYYTQTTEDERYLIITETQSTSGNNLRIKRLGQSGEFIRLTTGFDYDYSVIGSVGDSLYVLTNYHAPRYKLVRINVNSTDVGSWVDVLPERSDVLTGCQMAGGRLVAEYMHDAASQLGVYSLKGDSIASIEMPMLGSVGQLTARPDSKQIFLTYSSFVLPSVVYSYDLDEAKLEEVFRPAIDFDFDNYTVERVFYPSTGNQEVPMFIVHRKDIEFNGENPTLLYGYGGFNISLTPSFSASRLSWLEQGGVYAQACLRGGGEYGEKWHRGGTKLNKQNVFDDCIKAAEFLIAKGYTSPSRLALQGGSNGGLLVGAVVNQRPDLFAAAIPQVGVMDMLRYQLFTIGWAWADDYGTSDEDEDQFRALYAYSPYHNIVEGANYPSILVTTADHDDRVVPAHSFKYAARLQALQARPASRPKLIRIGSRAGHGAGKPLSATIEEQADIYSFIYKAMGVTPTLP